MADIVGGGNENQSQKSIITRIPVHKKPKTPGWKHQRRYFVSLLTFFGFFILSTFRVNFPVAIVAMTSGKNSTNGTIQEKPEFDWNHEIQDVLVNSFSYGYVVTQIAGGYLSLHFEGKRIYGSAVGVSSICSLMIPFLARTDIYFMVTARVLQGFFEGLALPATYCFWSKWAPPLERSQLAAFPYSGNYIGYYVALPTSALLVDYIGWQSVFYLFGLLGIAWCVIWYTIIHESPQTDPRISDEELTYINNCLPMRPSFIKDNPRIPWKRMLLSFPVWAIMIAQFCESWGFYTLSTDIPTYMNDILGFVLPPTGSLIALPYLSMGVFVFIAGFVADYLRSKMSVTTIKVRKLFTCIGFFCQGLFFLFLGHVSSPTLLMICMTLFVGFDGFAWSGFGINHFDIAPKFACFIMGLSGTLGALPATIAPAVTSSTVKNKTLEEWQTVFYITSVVYLLGAGFYGLCASGEKQPWAISDTDIVRHKASNKRENARRDRDTPR